MNIPFTLAQLEYVVALDTHRHFVTAAEKCFVTQPTLSAQIKKMEQILGAELFDRSKQPVIPTDIGTEVVTHAREILRLAADISASVQFQQGKIAGHLRLGIIPTLAGPLLPRFIGPFTRAFPEVELVVREMITEEVIAALQKDELDAGLIVTPVEARGIHARPLFYEEILVYAHPSLGWEGKVNGQQLTEAPLWLLSEGNCFREQVLNLCALRRQAETKAGFVYESGSLDTLRRLVDEEGGCTVLPKMAIPAGGSLGSVLELGPVRPYREVGLVAARTFAKQKLLQILAHELQKVSSLPQRLPAGGEVVRWQ